MKRNIVLVVIFLINAVIGVAGFGIYRNMQNMSIKIANLETQGADGKYDFNNNLIKSLVLDKFFKYKADVKTSVLLEIPEELRSPDSDSVTRTSEAPAMIIGRYVLMASHVSDAEILSQQTIMVPTLFGMLKSIFKLKVLKYEVEFLAPDGEKYPLEELYRNKEKDFSLFKLAENAKAPNFPFEIGKSDELKIGNFIYLNGRPSIRSEVARPGFVTSLAKAFFDKESKVIKNNDKFGLSQSTDHGDSGSLIVAFRDGQPELVGIYLGWTGMDGDNGRNTQSRALKINVAVDEIKEKLGLDLRETQRIILSSPRSISPYSAGKILNLLTLFLIWR